MDSTEQGAPDAPAHAPPGAQAATVDSTPVASAQPSQPPKKLRKPRVLIAHNHTELSVLAEVPEPTSDAVRELTALLAASEFDVLLINAEDDCDRIGDAVVVYRPDLILNLIDHFHGDTMLAGPAAGLLDIFEYPYTGGDGHCISGCQDRLRTHLALKSASLRVPPFVGIWTRGPMPDVSGLRYPVIVTQSFDDIYHRADERPQLANVGEVQAYVTEVLADYDPPLIVEEYIDHQRMSVIVVAEKYTLPPCEVWQDENDEWNVALAELTSEQGEFIAAVALEASAVMECRDLSQVEIAINVEGDVFVTDVRPFVTPWNPDSPFRVAAAAHETGAVGVLADVVRSALARAARKAKLEAETLAELDDPGEARSEEATEAKPMQEPTALTVDAAPAVTAPPLSAPDAEPDPTS